MKTNSNLFLFVCLSVDKELIGNLWLFFLKAEHDYESTGSARRLRLFSFVQMDYWIRTDETIDIFQSSKHQNNVDFLVTALSRDYIQLYSFYYLKIRIIAIVISL